MIQALLLGGYHLWHHKRQSQDNENVLTDEVNLVAFNESLIHFLNNVKGLARYAHNQEILSRYPTVCKSVRNGIIFPIKHL